MKKRILVVLLALSMLLGAIPALTEEIEAPIIDEEQLQMADMEEDEISFTEDGDLLILDEEDLAAEDTAPDAGEEALTVDDSLVVFDDAEPEEVETSLGSLVVADDPSVEEPAEEVVPEYCWISDITKILYVGESYTLGYTVGPEGASQEVSWKSSDSQIAKIDQKGTVTALKPGTAKVTVSTPNKKSAVCKVTVKENKKILQASVSNADMKSVKGRWALLAKSLEFTSDRRLKASFYVLNGTSKASTYIKSLQLKICNGKKLVAERKFGKIAMKAKPNSYTTMTVTFPKASVRQFLALPNTGNAAYSLFVKKGLTLQAGKAVTFKNLDKRIKFYTPVTYVSKIKLAPTKLELFAGRAATVKATVSPSNAKNKTVTWSSSNTSIAKVSSKGVVTGLAPGTATITVTAKDDWHASTTLKVTVTQAPKVALLVSDEAPEAGTLDGDAWSTISSYCTAEGLSCQYTTDVDEAVASGYSVIIVVGFMTEAVESWQTDYPNVKFICLDGSVENPGSNVFCAHYKVNEAGFMAGYAAVKLGYRKLGFLGGMETDDVVSYGEGFIYGANQAAKELNATDKVTVRRAYTGVFWPETFVESQAAGWYDDGVEVIFCCGGSQCESVAAAATQKGGKIIGVDTDQASLLPGHVVTSAMKAVGYTAKYALVKLLNREWSDLAGKDQTLGIVSTTPAKNHVQLSASTQFGTGFTTADYSDMVGKLKNGKYKLTGDVSISVVDEPAVIIVAD